MFKKIIGAGIVAAVSCAVFFTVGKGPQTSVPVKVLIVGTNAEFPPFTSVDQGQLVGFDIDVAEEVAKRLGLTIRFQDMPFDALLPAVTLGSIQVVAAGMSYTKERAERVLFTQPYLEGEPLEIVSLVRQEPQNLTLQSLKGKTVVVNEGFTADLLLSQDRDLSLLRLATTADAFLALRNGRADAFVTAKSTVDAFLAVQKTLIFERQTIPGTAETTAMMVSKKYPLLLTEIQLALDAMIADGTMQTLKQKWLL